MTVREYLETHGPPRHGEVGKVAAQLGVRRTWFSTVMARSGYRTRTRQERVRAVLERMNIDSLPYGGCQYIAREMGESPMTVWRAARSLGITFRRGPR